MVPTPRGISYTGTCCVVRAALPASDKIQYNIGNMDIFAITAHVKQPLPLYNIKNNNNNKKKKQVQSC